MNYVRSRRILVSQSQSTGVAANGVDPRARVECPALVVFTDTVDAAMLRCVEKLHSSFPPATDPPVGPAARLIVHLSRARKLIYAAGRMVCLYRGSVSDHSGHRMIGVVFCFDDRWCVRSPPNRGLTSQASVDRMRSCRCGIFIRRVGDLVIGLHNEMPSRVRRSWRTYHRITGDTTC